MAEHQQRFAGTGVWAHTDLLSATAAAEVAQRIEALGYSRLWISDGIGRDPFAHLAWLASQTTDLQFATGIANIFHRHPGPMKQASNTLGEQSNNRFALGLGVSHGPLVEGIRGLDYSKPLTQMRNYLAAMKMQMFLGIEPSEPVPLLIAALGPKMLELAGAEANGAFPYWTTPTHTAQAREILGPDAVLCVEQKVILTTNAELARSTANTALDLYASFPNYRNNWLRLGYTNDDIDGRSARFIDDVAVWGNEDQLHAGVQAHYDAGADHVCVQPLSVERGDEEHGIDWRALEALAP